jgi:hypothetical protein
LAFTGSLGFDFAPEQLLSPKNARPPSQQLISFFGQPLLISPAAKNENK